MTTHHVYRNTRPALTVSCVKSGSLGNCYSFSDYEVTSTRKLDKKQLRALFDAGFLGSGQEFSIEGFPNGVEVPASVDSVPCVTEINGVAQPGPAINPYSGKAYEPMEQPYYIYKTQCRCDSGD